MLFVAACSAPPSPQLEAPPPAPSSPAWAQISPEGGLSEADAGREEAEAGPPAPIAVIAWFFLRARADGARDLILRLDPLEVERVVAVIPSEQRCAAESNKARGAGLFGLMVGCGFAPRVSVFHRGDSLSIEPVGGPPSSLLLPAGATVKGIDGPLADPASGAGCEGVPARKKPLSVLIDYRADDPTNAAESQMVHLLIPEFKVDLTLGSGVHEYCRGSHDPHKKTYRTSCSTGEGGSSVKLSIEGDSLLISTSSSDYDSSSHSTLGGLQLPCGAAVSFPKLHHKGRRYSPMGGPCFGRCGDAHELCEERCITRYSEAEDSPRPECQLRCSSQLSSCIGRCR